MKTNGVTGVSTPFDSAATLLAMGAGTLSAQQANRLVITNTSANAGYFSLDGGSTWGYIPAAIGGKPVPIEVLEKFNRDVLMKRVAGGTNLSGVFASASYVDLRRRR